MSRGRGRGTGLSFNAELLGIGRGPLAAPSVLAPPPKYPPRPGRIVPLVENAEQEYLLAVRKEFGMKVMGSMFYLRDKKSDRVKSGPVERYADRQETDGLLLKDPSTLL